jgi:hypothetical protein
MSLSDYYNRQSPEYYDTMYMDGYTPEQIMTALRTKLNREREESREATEIPNVKIISEVKVR